MNSKVINFSGKRADRERLQNAKWAYATRRVDIDNASTLVRANRAPQVGDVVLARITKIGQHKRIELASGRRARLFVGDEVVVVYGNRYAPDQFEAVIPHDMAACDLVAAGGIAARLTFRHEAVKAPTAIKPVGLVADENGRILNLSDFALESARIDSPLPPVIAVVGSSMNAGKTTAAAHLVRGLTQSGYSVSAGKVTGTGAGGDNWFMRDAGARHVVDFLDAGYPSTYLLTPTAVRQTFLTLLAHLNQPGTDFIVIEIADGLHQAETAELVSSDIFSHHVDGVIYASGDALGAVYGVDLLEQWGVRVLAVSGQITRSPLGIREIQDAADIPVLGTRVLNSTVIQDYVSEWMTHKEAALVRTGAGQ